MTQQPSKRSRRWPWVVLILLMLLVGGWFAARVPDLAVAELRTKYATPASSFVAVEPGLSVHVRDEGPRDALPVMLLHGSSASLQTWEPWVARLKARYRVITLDLPGHGLTGPHPRRDYSTEAFTAVVGKVADARGLGTFVLGGNSMGGAIAAAYAGAHPGRIAGLILVDAAGAPFKGKTDLPLGFRIARTPVVRDIVEDITPRAMIATSLEQTVADPAVVTPAMVDRYWELLRYPGNRKATIDRFETLYTKVDGAALARVTAPALILWGRDDRLIPVDSADWFRKTLPNSRVVVLDNVGHVPMEEVPDASLAPVLEFLGGLAQSPRAATRIDAR